MLDIQKQPHGRETYIVNYGDFVLKRPLPQLSDTAREKWLVKQHKTKKIVDEIRAVGNPTYNIPDMHFVHPDEYQVLEEYAPGEPLTDDLYNSLTQRQKYEIVSSLAGFLVDMNELREVSAIEQHNMVTEIKHQRLGNFIDSKMHLWFNDTEIKYMRHIYNAIGAFDYETRRAWSHCDLNSGNVLYDQYNSKLWIIDFAEANYHFIYRDIFSPLAIELDICRNLYDLYTKMHDHEVFTMPGLKSRGIRDIMKYRMMTALLRRFIKASDDMRVNAVSEKALQNNAEKVAFMRGVMSQLRQLEEKYGK